MFGCEVMDKSFQFKKSLGQNFLQDKNVVHNIIEKSCIDKETLVIEIGPGSGALTVEIVPLCGYSILYEADGRLENVLNNLLSHYNNYSLVIGDFLKRDILKDIENFHYPKLYVVANLPYYITTPIIMKLIEESILPEKIVIMVQKEVAYRLAARVGSRDYGSFTVLLNYYYDIYKLFDVSRNCFVPKPNVDSAVICMELKKIRYEVKDISLFKKVVRDSFSLKRKNLRNNLKKYPLDVVEEVLKKYQFDLNVRAEQLSLEVFVDIANALVNTL